MGAHCDCPDTAMKEPPRPAHEDDRLQALRQLLILDTPPEEQFDRLTAFAAQEFDMPIVLLSLIDEKRQWFKSRHGLDVCETARGISFCGHAILHDDTMVVPDAALDERFADNPLVTGDPHIQFYAGAPLKMPGGAEHRHAVSHRPHPAPARRHRPGHPGLAARPGRGGTGAPRQRGARRMSPSAAQPPILLVEPSSLTASIIVSTARQLNMPAVRQVSSVRTAQQHLAAQGFLGVIVSLEEEQEAVALLEQVRGARFAVHAQVPVAVTTAQVDASTAVKMKALQVRRVLLKPFKVRDVIATIQMLQHPA
ncbi:hypothetical protein ACINB_01770 [Acidovorax sp. NB1]|nr:hypothetical protein ACINB_01770 [Acidovorax sp. NB1]